MHSLTMFSDESTPCDDSQSSLGVYFLEEIGKKVSRAREGQHDHVLHDVKIISFVF